MFQFEWKKDPMPGNSVPGKAKPPYAINSVDVALQLAALIQLEGSMTTKRAAERLNIAQSTAHRMLAMLVYRDFAIKDGHTYRVGPILKNGTTSNTLVSLLREAAAIPMTGLDDQFDETTTLVIRSGTTVRIVAEIECSHQLRVGHRTGMAAPAHETPSGIMLLSLLTDDELRGLYAFEGESEEPSVDSTEIRARIQKAREKGFVVDNGNYSKGVAVVAFPVMYPMGSPLAALSIAIPSSRYRPEELGTMVAGLRSAARQIELELPLNARRQEVGHINESGVREQLVV